MTGLSNRDWLKALADVQRKATERLAEIDREQERLEAERKQLLTAFPQLKRKRASGSADAEILYDAAQPEPPVEVTKRGTPRKLRKWTEEEKEAVLQRVRRGEYLTLIADEMRIDSSLIRTWCKQENVKPKPMPPDLVRARKAAGRIKANAAGSDASAARADAVRRMREGESANTVARSIGVAKSTVLYWLKTANREADTGDKAAARAKRNDERITIPTLAFIANSKGERADAQHIAKKFGMTQNAAAKRMRAFEERGLLERDAAQFVSVTQQGRELINGHEH